MLLAASESVTLPIRLPVRLAGFEAGPIAQTVRRPLEANVLLLRLGAAEIVVVTLDLLFVGRHLRQGVERRVAHKVRPDQLIMAASHTHYAPATDLDKPALGGANVSWVEELAGLVAQAIIRLVESSAVGVDLMHGVGESHVAVNRRKRRLLAVSRAGIRWRPTLLAPNPKGYVDRAVHVIKVGDDEGRLRAVLWSMACHPVSLKRSTAIDSHYIGHVRDRIRQRAHDSELPVLFLQGFAGNCRPFIRKQVRSPLQIVSRVAVGPGFGPFPTSDDEEVWMERVDADVASVVCSSLHIDCLRSARVLLPRSRFVRSVSDSPASFSAVQLGPLLVTGGSAEFVGEYRAVIGAAGNSRHMTVGYLDDVFGYAATDDMLQHGGYEVEGFCPCFGVETINPGIEHATVEGFRQVASALNDRDVSAEAAREPRSIRET